MVNQPLLLDTIAAIEANLDKWDQHFFANGSGKCGTTYCLAGWAMAITYGPDEKDWPVFRATEYEAAELLGFSHLQADRLFFAFEDEDNDLEYDGYGSKAQEAWASYRELIRQETGV